MPIVRSARSFRGLQGDEMVDVVEMQCKLRRGYAHQSQKRDGATAWTMG
jgi:hypothetical protein